MTEKKLYHLDQVPDVLKPYIVRIEDIMLDTEKSSTNPKTRLDNLVQGLKSLKTDISLKRFGYDISDEELKVYTPLTNYIDDCLDHCIRTQLYNKLVEKK